MRLVRGSECQRSGGVSPVGRIVPRMALAIVDDHFAEIERRNAFQAGDVDAELIGIRAALVMGIDAADLAEVMLRDLRVEAIGRELVLTLQKLEAVLG